MDLSPEFHKHVKEALEHLYDTAYLETHPLTAQFANQPTESRLTRAQRLRTVLKETIETLRPQTGTPTSPEWRSYLALRYRYIQGMTSTETEHELNLSLRQLQRELHKGLEALAIILWEQRPTLPNNLQTEFDQWQITREVCPLATLLDDTRWLITPLLAERQLTLEIDPFPPTASVFVDATLTRQALFKVLRSCVRQLLPSPIFLRVRETPTHLHLTFELAQNADLATSEDWQAAQELCAQQGGTLNHTAAQIDLTLPRATQARILVIDDNAAIHQLFERYLAPHHYAVFHAHNGAEALKLVQQNPPDAITLDVMMPHTDGWQVLRSLAANEATARIPVVICSVLKEPELAFSLGARAYLKKPVERLELLATLAQLLAVGNPRTGSTPNNA